MKLFINLLVFLILIAGCTDENDDDSSKPIEEPNSEQLEGETETSLTENEPVLVVCSKMNDPRSFIRLTEGSFDCQQGVPNNCSKCRLETYEEGIMNSRPELILYRTCGGFDNSSAITNEDVTIRQLGITCTKNENLEESLSAQTQTTNNPN